MVLYRRKYIGADLREIIAEMARSRKKELRLKNPTIPLQLISYMIENTGYNMDPKEGARIYFDAWMES